MADLSLPVHRHLVLANDGSVTAGQSVFCPARARSVETSTCRDCAHAHAVLRDVVLCAPSAPELPTGQDAPAGALASPEVGFVRSDVPAGAVLDLAKRTAAPLLVVDDGDRFLGFVSSGPWSLPQWPWSGSESLVARDLAKARNLLVVETATVGDALRFMARRGVRWLALLDASGVLRGALSDVQALSALARGAPASSIAGASRTR